MALIGREDVLDDGVAVHRMGKGLAHIQIVKGWIEGVEHQIVGAEIAEVTQVVLAQYRIGQNQLEIGRGQQSAGT